LLAQLNVVLTPDLWCWSTTKW